MAEPEIFDTVAAAAALPGLPEPAQSHGAGMVGGKIGRAMLRFASDGAMALPFRILAPEADPKELLKVTGLGAIPEMARGEMSSVLIEMGTAVVLVDAGAGQGWQAGAGRLIRHLAANAIAPETVTHLVLTHLHPDHAWGALTSAGFPAFPNAKLYVGKAEAAFWSRPGLADKVQSAHRATVLGAARLLEALADRLHPVVEGDEIIPGLSVLDTPGHSPGHISLMLSEGPGVILTGDAVVNDVISFARPDWAFGFDTDAERAVISRRRLLELGADGGHLMAGYHWRWPGLGHASRAPQGFRFHPQDGAFLS